MKWNSQNDEAAPVARGRPGNKVQGKRGLLYPCYTGTASPYPRGGAGRRPHDSGAPVMRGGFGITVFEKAGGPLTKRIGLVAGKLESDSSDCSMVRGTASRWWPSGIGELAYKITQFTSCNALSLGSLRSDLPDQVAIVTKRELDDRDGRIARTAENITFQPGIPALTLLDFDTKSMPPHVTERIDEMGGFEAALLVVLPALASAARLLRASTSAGLYREDTGESLPGSNGMHALVLILDGTDNPRFLGSLHERCWLAGLGWYTLGAAGQLLDRSIIDRVVGSPERLVFEGPPVLTPPLRQNAEARRPIVTEGGALDTIMACPPLTVVEKVKLAELKMRASAQLQSEAEKKRAEFIKARAERLAKRTGMSSAAARFVAERQSCGVLLPDVTLRFDDPEFDGMRVADVLAGPEKFVGETLADPIEGISYGRGKAKIMQRADGALSVHSFAHGGTVYELKQDFIGAKQTLQKAAAEDADKLFVELALSAELDPAEQDKLRELAISKSGTRKRVLDSMVKKARTEVASRCRH